MRATFVNFRRKLEGGLAEAAPALGTFGEGLATPTSGYFETDDGMYDGRQSGGAGPDQVSGDPRSQVKGP